MDNNHLPVRGDQNQYKLQNNVSLLLDSGCNVVPILEWAGSPIRREDVLENPVDLAIIIHTVTPQCFTDDDCQNVSRSIRNFLMHHGQTDVGYS